MSSPTCGQCVWQTLERISSREPTSWWNWTLHCAVERKAHGPGKICLSEEWTIPGEHEAILQISNPWTDLELVGDGVREPLPHFPLLVVIGRKLADLSQPKRTSQAIAPLMM